MTAPQQPPLKPCPFCGRLLHRVKWPVLVSAVASPIEKRYRAAHE